jgi:SnoaL-like domain
MDILQRFMAYASAFEQAFGDDDWTRLRPYFATDALYLVDARDFGCRLVGPDAIVAGFKKSVDGFDRRFERRDTAVTSAPEVDGDEMRVGWTVTYTKTGVAPLALRGRSMVRYRDGVIAQLTDSFDADMERELAAWQRDNDLRVDLSYT